MQWLVRPARAAISEAIDGIETATQGKTIDDYGREWLLRHGLQRGIEVISETARRIPWNYRPRNPRFRGGRSWVSVTCCAMSTTAYPTASSGMLSNRTCHY